MDYSKIEIKTEDKPSTTTHIYIDGIEIRGVRNYELKQEAGKPAILTLDLNALDISVDNPMVHLNQRGLYGGIKITRENGTSYEIPRS